MQTPRTVHLFPALATTTLSTRDGRAWRLTVLRRNCAGAAVNPQRVEIYSVDAHGMETFVGYYDDVCMRSTQRARAFVAEIHPLVAGLLDAARGRPAAPAPAPATAA